MLDNYDKVYPIDNIPEQFDKTNFIIHSVREAFFNAFLPFLRPAYMMIDLTCKDPTSLYKFFDKNGYLYYIEEHTPDDRAQ